MNALKDSDETTEEPSFQLKEEQKASLGLALATEIQSEPEASPAVPSLSSQREQFAPLHAELNFLKPDNEALESFPIPPSSIELDDPFQNRQPAESPLLVSSSPPDRSPPTRPPKEKSHHKSKKSKSSKKE